MIYLKINEKQNIIYPYTIQRLKSENPNTSFPEEISISLLEDYQVYPVHKSPIDQDYTKNYVEGEPELIDGLYHQTWIIIDASQEEIDERLNSKWSKTRITRNNYLKECDWTQLSDSPLSIDKKLEWSIYRQELRDVTSQEDPFNVVWPIKPE
jgi:hypothetical protein